MAKKYYLLLSYYPEKLERSLALFARLNRIIGELQLVVIDNSHDRSVKRRHPSLNVVDGDNSLWEFSGWSCGVNWIRRDSELAPQDVMVFANDTATSHRLFSYLDCLIFARALIRQVRQGGSFLLGDTNYSREELSLGGIAFDAWVSTYLFATTAEFIERCNYSLTLDVSEIGYIRSVDSRSITFADTVSEVLARHVNHWLFPAHGTRGWYNADRSTPQKKVQKSLAILCEKKLSVKAQESGVRIASIYSGALQKHYRKMARSIFKKLKTPSSAAQY